MFKSPSAELMTWKSVSFILSTTFYEMLLDLEQKSCGDRRWILSLWGLPLALYQEHISEHEYRSVPSEIFLQSYEDWKENICVSRGLIGVCFLVSVVEITLLITLA